jgi:transcriptional regulator with XRE-family HTH domain
MNKLHLGEAVKRKRQRLTWSRSTLAYKSGVSEATVGKIEKGNDVKQESLSKVLTAIDMKEHLNTYNEDSKIVNQAAMSLTELRTAVQVCKDFIREGDEKTRIEMATIKRIAEEELKKRIRTLFRGHENN